MPDPIPVDFRRRRPTAKGSSPKGKGPSLNGKGSGGRGAPTPPGKPPKRPKSGGGEPAINWRALPRFLMIVVPILVIIALLQWLLRI